MTKKPLRCRLSGLALLLSTTVLISMVTWAPAAQEQPVAATARPESDIITPGQILLRRTESAMDPATQASWEDKLKQQIADLQKQMLSANDQQLSKMRDDNARLQQQLTTQQLLMAETSSAREAATQAKLQAAQVQLAAQSEATEAKVQAMADTTAARLAAHENVTEARMALVQKDTEASGKLTDLRLAQLNDNTNAKLAGMAQIADTESKLNDARVAALSADVQSRLNDYATNQLARVERETKQAVADAAQTSRLDVLALQNQTATKLAEIRDQANAKAAAMAEARAQQTEAKLASAIQTRTSPDDVKQLAREQVADAQPEMRALALQTLSDSQDYIKTVAKDAIKDGDPAVQEAMADAAKNIITKDNKVVFAMRQAMARQIADENAAGAGAPTPNGGDGALNNVDPGAGPDTTSGTLPAPDTRTAQGLLGNDIDANSANLQVTAPAANNLGTAQVMAALAVPHTSLLPARNRRDWVDLRQYHVVVHEDGKTLEELIGTVLKRAEPFTGPWRVKWKISNENKDILATKFSLDTETTFDQFVAYLAQYLVNDRGVKITFSLFDRDRILVVSDQ